MKYKRNKEGYLLNFNEWNEKIARIIAYQENIKLRDSHWKIIYYMRMFYTNYSIVPSVRMLIQGLQKDYPKDTWNSFYIFELFPLGLKKQATKIAGLPEQFNCL